MTAVDDFRLTALNPNSIASTCMLSMPSFRHRCVIALQPQIKRPCQIVCKMLRDRTCAVDFRLTTVHCCMKPAQLLRAACAAVHKPHSPSDAQHLQSDCTSISSSRQATQSRTGQLQPYSCCLSALCCIKIVIFASHVIATVLR